MSIFCSGCGNQLGLCNTSYLDCLTGDRTKPCDKLREKHGDIKGCIYFKLKGCKW